MKESDDDPDADTLVIDEDSKTEHLIFAFELDADDSDNDITLDNFVSVNVNVGGTDGTSLNNFIDDFRLEIDGESFDAESYTGTATTAVIDFDIDGDVTIDAGDAVQVMLYAMFDDVGSSFSDAVISASTTPAQIDAEGADDLTVTGSSVVDGEQHTVRTDGADIDFVSDSYSLKVNSDSTADDDQGVFTIKFDVTAINQDLYFNKNASRGSSATTTGAEFIITSAGVTIGSNGTTTSSLTSTASTVGGKFKVSEGQTKQFTLKVEYDPLTSGFYAVEMTGVNFTDSSSGTTFTGQAAVPTEDFQTDEESI